MMPRSVPGSSSCHRVAPAPSSVSTGGAMARWGVMWFAPPSAVGRVTTSPVPASKES